MYCIKNYSALNLTLEPIEIYVDFFHLVCAPLTVALNCLVLLIGLRYVNIANRVSQWLVLAMTASDLCIGLIYMPTKFYIDCFPRAICSIYYIVVWLAQMMSIQSLLLLNFDKFINLRWPLRYRQLVTKRSIAIQLAISFSVVLSIAVGTAFGRYTSYVPRAGIECVVSIKPEFYLSILLLFYIFPLICSWLISLMIFLVAKQWIIKREQSSFDYISTSAAEQSVQWSKYWTKILFVFSSTFSSCLTILPYRIGYATWIFLSLFERDSLRYQSFKQTIYLLWFLLPLGAVVNPLITIWTQRSYTIGLWMLSVGVMKQLRIPVAYWPQRLKRSPSLHQLSNIRINRSQRLYLRQTSFPIVEPSTSTAAVATTNLINRNSSHPARTDRLSRRRSTNT